MKLGNIGTKIKLSIKANGEAISGMDMEEWSGAIQRHMRGLGSWGTPVGREFLLIVWVIGM
jgi:hypothetical protein